MIYPATRLIAAELEQNGIKYRVNEEDSFSEVSVGFNCKNVNSIEVRFISTDDDSDVNIAYDFAVSTSSDCLGASCFEMLRRFVNIADEAYPDIMKALWA